MNKNLGILLWSFFLINTSFGLLGPIYAIYVEKIGGDILTVGSSYAVFAIGTAIIIYLISKYEDSFSSKAKLLLVSRFIFLACAISYLFISNPMQLFILQLALGIATAIGNPAFDSLYQDNIEKGKSASQWGAWESSFYFSIGVSALSGSIIVQYFGFTTLFYVMIALNIIGIILTLKLPLEASI